jgi:hypothetical protein
VQVSQVRVAQEHWVACAERLLDDRAAAGGVFGCGDAAVMDDVVAGPRKVAEEVSLDVACGYVVNCRDTTLELGIPAGEESDDELLGQTLVEWAALGHVRNERISSGNAID